MHELALVESICEVIDETVKERGVNRVLQVRLLAGGLTGIEDAMMKACFEIVVQNTPAEGAELVIEHTPIRVQCRECGNEYQTEIPFSGCTVCGSGGIRVLSGRELYIESLEVE